MVNGNALFLLARLTARKRLAHSREDYLQPPELFLQKQATIVFSKDVLQVSIQFHCQRLMVHTHFYLSHNVTKMERFTAMRGTENTDMKNGLENEMKIFN